MTLHRWQLAAAAWALCGAGGALAAPAHDADPLDAPECRRAMAALEAHEQGLRAAAAAPPASAALARRQALQKAALRVCLGSRADPAPRPSRAQAPVGVPPVRIGGATLERAAPARPTDRPPPAAPIRPAPSVVLSCDAVGCWANDGRYLFRQGPLVNGPNGACTAVGSVLMCP